MVEDPKPKWTRREFLQVIAGVAGVALGLAVHEHDPRGRAIRNLMSKEMVPDRIVDGKILGKRTSNEKGADRFYFSVEVEGKKYDIEVNKETFERYKKDTIPIQLYKRK